MKKKAKITNLGFMLGHLWKAAPGYVISSFFVTIIQGFIEIVISVYLFRYIINGIQTGISFYQLLLVVSVTLLGVFLAFCLLDWYNNVYLQKVNIRLSKYFDKLIFSKSIEIDLENYDNPEFYNKYAKAINETTGRATGVWCDLTSLISSITVIISLVTLLLTMDPLLIVFSVAPVVLTLPLSFLRNKFNYNFTNDVALENRKVNYYKQVLKEKEYAKEFRMSKVYEVLLNRYDLSMDRLEKTNHKYGIKRFGMGVWETFNQIGVVMYIPYIYLIYRIVVAGTLLIGDFVSMYNAVRTAEGYIRRIIQIAPKMNEHCLFIDNLKDFLNMKKSIQGSNDGLTPERDINISIDNLSFQYTGNDNYVLKNIFMNIEHNQKIAIVGRNGAGKSTLVKLLMHLYEPQNGEILQNNIPIGNYSADKYREQFATVFQDFKLFRISVAENVLMRSVENKDDEEIVYDALKKVGLYDKVMSYEKGIYTEVSRDFDENGIVFSGGEEQKIAIARALAKNSNILIFDEASSALDPVAEYEINSLILSIAADKTVIIISHRLSTSKGADVIYYLENGEVAEFGSHEHLISIDGKYAEMFNIQATQYNTN